jgi:hypothetical protein
MTKKVLTTADKTDSLFIPEPYIIDHKKKPIIEIEMRLTPNKREEDFPKVLDQSTVIIIDL